MFLELTKTNGINILNNNVCFNENKVGTHNKSMHDHKKITLL